MSDDLDDLKSAFSVVTPFVRRNRTGTYAPTQKQKKSYGLALTDTRTRVIPS